MEKTFFYKNTNKEEERVFFEYVNSKTDAIESLLTRFAEDAVILRASIEKFDKHDAYEVELRLDLHRKPLIAREASHQINKAVDLAKDRLVAQVKKNIAQMRDTRPHKAIKEEEKMGTLITEEEKIQ